MLSRYALAPATRSPASVIELGESPKRARNVATGTSTYEEMTLRAATLLMRFRT